MLYKNNSCVFLICVGKVLSFIERMTQDRQTQLIIIILECTLLVTITGCWYNCCMACEALLSIKSCMTCLNSWSWPVKNSAAYSLFLCCKRYNSECASVSLKLAAYYLKNKIMFVNRKYKTFHCEDISIPLTCWSMVLAFLNYLYYIHCRTFQFPKNCAYVHKYNLIFVPVSYLSYGDYGSYGPTYDSTFSNLTKEESDLVYSTYGDETGVQYAER